MLKVSFAFPAQEMPRTVFYQQLCETLCSYPGFTPDADAADLVFPAEDTAVETNWPRYARPESAFLRGSFQVETHLRYLERLAGAEKPLCIVNMHPFMRLPALLADRRQILVADINLLAWERAANPRTISMPALPITVGSFEPGAKRIVASFRGVDSHPCRGALAGIHDGKDIVVDMVPRGNHFGRIDAQKGEVDSAYVDLLKGSVFAFVPRGDAEFSYRLLEVMSFGCIPVILADGLVLPFDRTIDWDSLSLRVPERRIPDLPAILAAIPAARVEAMQQQVLLAYRLHLSGFPAVVGTLLAEAAGILAGRGAHPEVPPTTPTGEALARYAERFRRSGAAKKDVGEVGAAP